MSQENLICSFCNKSRKDVTKMIVGQAKVAICNNSNIAAAIADAHEEICQDNKVYTQQRHISSKSHLSVVLQHDSPAT